MIHRVRRNDDGIDESTMRHGRCAGKSRGCFNSEFFDGTRNCAGILIPDGNESLSLGRQYFPMYATAPPHAVQSVSEHKGTHVGSQLDALVKH